MTRTTIASLLIITTAAGCSGGPKDQTGRVRAACERYVKNRVGKGARISAEKVDIGSVRTRATMDGVVDSVMASPAPGGPTRIGMRFTCSVERRHGRWELVVPISVNR